MNVAWRWEQYFFVLSCLVLRRRWCHWDTMLLLSSLGLVLVTSRVGLGGRSDGRDAVRCGDRAT